MSRPADLPLHRGGQLGESLLEPGDASRAVSQAQPDPGVRVAGQHLAGGPGRQDRALLLVGLIDQGRWDLHDGGHPVGMGELPAYRHPFRVHPVVGVRDMATNSRTEHPGDERGEHDLAGRAEPGQPAGQDRRPVLGEPLAVQAGVDSVGEEGLVDVAVDHGVGVDADVRDVGDDTRQRGDQRDGPEHRRARQDAIHIDERVADPARRQVTPVRGVRTPSARHGTQRNGTEQAAEQGQHQRLPPTAPHGRPPPVHRRGQPATPLWRAQTVIAIRPVCYPSTGNAARVALPKLTGHYHRGRRSGSSGR